MLGKPFASRVAESTRVVAASIVEFQTDPRRVPYKYAIRALVIRDDVEGQCRYIDRLLRGAATNHQRSLSKPCCDSWAFEVGVESWYPMTVPATHDTYPSITADRPEQGHG